MGLVIVRILISLFAISAASINFLAIFIIVSNRNLREDVTAKIMVSSAVGDLMSSLTPIGVIAVTSWIDLNPLPVWLANLQGISTKLFGQSSCEHLCLIAIVKCIVICRPFTHREILSNLKVGLGLAFIWAFSFLCGLVRYQNGAFLFIVRSDGFNYDSETYMTLPTPSADQSITYLIQFLLTSMTVVISYGIIFGTIVKHRRQISTVSQTSDNTGDSAADIARDFLRSVRGAKNMFIITIVYFIAYAPIIIGIVMKASIRASQQCMWIILLHTMTSSLLYMVLHKEVRDAVKKEFRKFWYLIFKGHGTPSKADKSQLGSVTSRY